MIGDNDKDGFGAGRLLKALPDPAPRHPAWGKELAPKLLHFHLPELWEIHLPMTPCFANLNWSETGRSAPRNVPGPFEF